MPPPRIQRSRQTVTTLAPPLPSLPPHYLAYTPTIPQLARQQAPAGRASGLLNYRYKRRDPASGSVPVAANTGGDPELNDDSGSDPDAKLANRLVTSVPEDSSTTSP